MKNMFGGIGRRLGSNHKPGSRAGKKSAGRGRQLFRISAILALTLLLALVSSWQQLLVTYSHNLQTKMVYMFFDPNTQAFLDARIAGNDSCFPSAEER